MTTKVGREFSVFHLKSNVPDDLKNTTEILCATLYRDEPLVSDRTQRS